MRRVFEKLSSGLDLFLERRPGFTRAMARYGWLAFPVLAALFVAGGVMAADDGGNQLFYAAEDGSLVSVEPESGAKRTLYAGSPDGYATAASTINSSGSLLFTVLREGPGVVRGDLYATDPASGMKSLLQAAEPGEAFVPAGYSSDQLRIAAGRHAEDEPPDAAILHESAATVEPLEPGGSSALVGPSWTYEDAIYAWKKDGSGRLTLTAHDISERMKTAVYETGERVGPAAYYPDANTLVFAERPRGAGLEKSRLKVLAGTSELSVAGEQGLGLYDPSPPIPALEDRMAVMWTDGEKSGVGLLDPEGWTFEKTGVTVEQGSRFPRISSDREYAATTSEEGIEIRRVDSGSLVRRIEDAQPPEAAFVRMRKAGLDAPPEAEWFAGASFGWRSF